MPELSGPFWDAMAGRAPMPPAATTLGWELVKADTEAGTIEVAFTANRSLTNPMGNVQGGFLAAMLDDTLGPALVATLGPGQFAITLELKVNFLRPAREGRLIGRVESFSAVDPLQSSTARSRTLTGRPSRRRPRPLASSRRS